MSTLDPKLDGERLDRQLDKVRALMLDGEWRTLDDISYHWAVRGFYFSTPSISARLRELRKSGFIVDRKRIGAPERGLFAYRVSKAEEFRLTA